MRMLDVAAVCCTFASFVLSIISIALPYWYYFEENSQFSSMKMNIGLWTICDDTTIFGKRETKCNGLDNAAYFLKATRAFEIIGLLLVVCAGLLGGITLCVNEHEGPPRRHAGGIAVVAGLFMIIGAIIYVAKTIDLAHTTGLTLHAGFALAIVSGVISIAGGGLFLAFSSNVAHVHPIVQ